MPWRKFKQKEQVGREKEKYDHKKFLEHLPEEMTIFYNHLNELNYETKPDYVLLKNHCRKYLDRNNVRDDEPLDWETPSSPDSKVQDSMENKPVVSAHMPEAKSESGADKKAVFAGVSVNVPVVSSEKIKISKQLKMRKDDNEGVDIGMGNTDVPAVVSSSQAQSRVPIVAPVNSGGFLLPNKAAMISKNPVPDNNQGSPNVGSSNQNNITPFSRKTNKVNDLSGISMLQPKSIFYADSRVADKDTCAVMEVRHSEMDGMTHAAYGEGGLSRDYLQEEKEEPERNDSFDASKNLQDDDGACTNDLQDQQIGAAATRQVTGANTGNNHSAESNAQDERVSKPSSERAETNNELNKAAEDLQHDLYIAVSTKAENVPYVNSSANVKLSSEQNNSPALSLPLEPPLLSDVIKSSEPPVLDFHNSNNSYFPEKNVPVDILSPHGQNGSQPTIEMPVASKNFGSKSSDSRRIEVEISSPVAASKPEAPLVQDQTATSTYSVASNSGRAKPRIPTPVPKKPGADFGSIFKQLKSGRKKSVEKPRGLIKALNPQMRSPNDKYSKGASDADSAKQSSQTAPHRPEKKSTRRQLPQVPSRAQSMDNLDSGNSGTADGNKKESTFLMSVRDTVKHFESMTDADSGIAVTSNAAVGGTIRGNSKERMSSSQSYGNLLNLKSSTMPTSSSRDPENSKPAPMSFRDRIANLREDMYKGSKQFDSPGGLLSDTNCLPCKNDSVII